MTSTETAYQRVIPRTRGALSGLALVALGAWGALLPMIGPSFHFGYGPDTSTFDLTDPRLYLQVIPGAVTFVAGLFILFAANRFTGIVMSYLAAAAGAWFVVGPILADLNTAGYVAAPIGSFDRQHFDAIATFYGLGVVIVFFAAIAAGRYTLFGLRERAQEVPAATPAPAYRQDTVAGAPVTDGGAGVGVAHDPVTQYQPVATAPDPATRVD